MTENLNPRLNYFFFFFFENQIYLLYIIEERRRWSKWVRRMEDYIFLLLKLIQEPIQDQFL